MNVRYYFGSFPGSILTFLHSGIPHMRKKGSKEPRVSWAEEVWESRAGEGREPWHRQKPRFLHGNRLTVNPTLWITLRILLLPSFVFA